MSYRTLAVLTVAGAAAAASAQERFDFKFELSEVFAGTTNPVPSPNGRIDPGEAARIGLRFKLAPGIGATATWDTLGGTGQTGTVAALGSILFDILGAGTGGERGAWTPPFARRAGFSLGWAGSVGSGARLGDVIDASAGQFLPPGASPMSSDDVAVWFGSWRPTDYSSKSIEFRLAPTAQTALLDAGIRDPAGKPLFVHDDWTAQSVPIRFDVVPAPAAALVVGVGGAPVLLRRRRHAAGGRRR